MSAVVRERTGQPPATLSHEEFRAQRYFPALDGIRAIAVLLVFKVHVQYQPSWSDYVGGNGVTVFFVLSGLLITTLALREEAVRGRLSLSSFYVRRLFRIYPTYFAVLGLYCLLTYVVHLQAERRALFGSQLPYYVLGFPEYRYFEREASGTTPPFAGAWSVGIEEKFYLVWPLLAFVVLAALASRRAQLRARLAVCVVVAVITAIAPVVLDIGDYLGPYLFIVLGCFGALVLHEEALYERVRGLGRGRVLGLLLLALVVLRLLDGADVVGGRDVAVLEGLLVAPALVGVLISNGPGTAWLRWPPLVLLGKISYVFYLLHNFCLNLVEKTPLGREGQLWYAGDVLVSLVLAAALSWVVHVVLERPLTRLGHRIGGRRKAFHEVAAS